MNHTLLLVAALCVGISPHVASQNTAVEIPMEANASERRGITGTVVDNEGVPLLGVAVAVTGDTKKNVVTDMDGRFSISDVPDSCVLQVSYIGFLPQRVQVVPNKNEYPIVMKLNNSMLEEVVVVGYDTQKKVDLTGAVSSVKVDAFEDRPVTNVANALAGLAPGLTVTNSGGNTPGYEAQSILVRGQGTLNNASPLVVVDGMTGISLSDINPQDIESISILKDAAAASIYGSRAANGVILLSTRQGKA